MLQILQFLAHFSREKNYLPNLNVGTQCIRLYPAIKILQWSPIQNVKKRFYDWIHLFDTTLLCSANLVCYIIDDDNAMCTAVVAGRYCAKPLRPAVSHYSRKTQLTAEQNWTNHSYNDNWVIRVQDEQNHQCVMWCVWFSTKLLCGNRDNNVSETCPRILLNNALAKV